MIVIAGLLLAVASVPLAGGRLGALAELRFRGVWLLVLALGLQVLIVSIVPRHAGGIHAPVHVVSYMLAAIFLLRNRDVPFLWVIGAGGVLNFAAIAANGGVMPARPAALAAAGQDVGEGFSNSAPVADAQLAFLGDVFALPAGLPLANVFSGGDVLIVVGALLLAQRVCGSASSASVPRF
jgi:hypothetical protein